MRCRLETRLGFGMGVLTAFLLAGSAQAARFDGKFTLLSQVREGDQSRDLEAPTILYGDLSGMDHGASVDTYFGLAHDFARNEGLFTDLYDASIRVPGVIPGVDFTLGRQLLAEVPGGIFVTDGGKVRFDFGGPAVFTIFGGQPQYFEPTYSSELLSQDEQIWGGSVRTKSLRNAVFTLGFLQQQRNGNTLRQLVSGSGNWSLPTLPGSPSLYGSTTLDSGHRNIDQATAGLRAFVLSAKLSLNLESTYYKPQDHGEFVNPEFQRREDPIFELFSVSDLMQFRGGWAYAFSPSLSGTADYSYQRYEKQSGDFENGHLGSAGIRWLPYGDGLEVVRLEYYIADSGGGQVNGGRLYYESSVYQRIVFRSGAALAYYEKASHENDFAVSGLLGLGYAILPGLVCEIGMEANSNQRFDQDFRFGFWLTYNQRYLTGRGDPARGEAS